MKFNSLEEFVSMDYVELFISKHTWCSRGLTGRIFCSY